MRRPIRYLHQPTRINAIRFGLWVGQAAKTLQNPTNTSTNGVQIKLFKNTGSSLKIPPQYLVFNFSAVSFFVWLSFFSYWSDITAKRVKKEDEKKKKKRDRKRGCNTTRCPKSINLQPIKTPIGKEVQPLHRKKALFNH